LEDGEKKTRTGWVVSEPKKKNQKSETKLRLGKGSFYWGGGKKRDHTGAPREGKFKKPALVGLFEEKNSWCGAHRGEGPRSAKLILLYVFKITKNKNGERSHKVGKGGGRSGVSASVPMNTSIKTKKTKLTHCTAPNPPFGVSLLQTTKGSCSTTTPKQEKRGGEV